MINYDKNDSSWPEPSVYTPTLPPQDNILNNGMEAEEAYRILTSENMFNPNPELNLTSFSTTFMDETGIKVMMDNLSKNYIDKLVYPQITKLERYCSKIIANLFNPTSFDKPFGISTIGSTEAAMLAALNYKTKWQNFNPAKDEKPEIIFGANAQVCWRKFAKYFDVTPVIIPIDEDGRMKVDDIQSYISSKTICVVGSLGNTYNGAFDDIYTLNQIINNYNKGNDWKLAIHVDAAGGGFVAPFYEPYDNIYWDFRLEWVKSINVSGHEYGLVFPGVGWGIWRNKDDIEPELIFEINYLDGIEFDFSLNFTKNASNIMGQYYNLTRLGRDGYVDIMTYLFGIKAMLEESLVDITYNDNPIFDIYNNMPGLPVVMLTLTDAARRLGLTPKYISENMERYGWRIPAFAMPEPIENIEVLKMVLSGGFNLTMANKLAEDMESSVKELLQQ